MTEPVSLCLRLRQPAQLEVFSPFARAVLHAAEPRTPRLRRKLARALFSLAHRRLRLPARARLRLANGALVAVDGADTAFLDFAVRLARDGAVEPEVTALLTHLAPRLRVVYDVGANWGYYPVLLGTDPRFAGQVHAFEIAPRTAEGLRRLVRAAGLDARVRVHGYGLSRQEDEVRLTREMHSYLARIVEEGYRGKTQRVRVRRLDGLGLPVPDLVKIDVEGHEEAVLRGGLELLRRHRPIVILESWHEPVAAGRPHAALALLESEGYALYRPIWHRGAGAAGRLELAPLAAAERASIAHSLNLVAADPARVARWAAL